MKCRHCGAEITFYSGDLYHSRALIFPQYCRKDDETASILHAPEEEEMKDFFDSFPQFDSNFDYKKYYETEQRVWKPAMEVLGYTYVEFWNLDSDSFGPLVRGVRALKDGKRHRWSYG